MMTPIKQNSPDEIKRILDQAGCATGDGQRSYTLAERVENLVTVKDYFVRQTDELRRVKVGQEEEERKQSLEDEALLPSTQGNAPPQKTSTSRSHEEWWLTMNRDGDLVASKEKPSDSQFRVIRVREIGSDSVEPPPTLVEAARNALLAIAAWKLTDDMQPYKEVGPDLRAAFLKAHDELLDVLPKGNAAMQLATTSVGRGNENQMADQFSPTPSSPQVEQVSAVQATFRDETLATDVSTVGAPKAPTKPNS